MTCTIKRQNRKFIVVFCVNLCFLMLSFWGFLILLFLICFFRHFVTSFSIGYQYVTSTIRYCLSSGISPTSIVTRFMQKKILPRNNIKTGLATPRFTGSLDLSSNLSRTYILNLVFISKLIKSICATAIEAVGTYLALWKTDSLKRRKCKAFTRMKN